MAKNEATAIVNYIGNRLKRMTGNAVMSRAQLLRSGDPDRRRNIYAECGYPETLSREDYRRMYDRESIAARVVQCMPREAWRVIPEVYEREKASSETDFDDAFRNLGRHLTPVGEWRLSDRIKNRMRTNAADENSSSWLNPGKSNRIFDYLRRVNELSGIGSFGVLLIGIDDGRDLGEPAKFAPGTKASRKLTFLRPFDEILVDITRFDSERESPRYGQPVEYMLKLYDASRDNDHSMMGEGFQTANVKVHWSRVLHVADNLGSSEVWGYSRQKHVFNRLYDLQKTYGGSAEALWQGGFPGLSFETHPPLGGDVPLEEISDELRDMIEQYFNGLQRYLVSTGMHVNSLAPNVADPSNHIDGLITAICIQLGIPKRIFMGTERGSLASSQDEKEWLSRLMAYQRDYLTHRIISPFIDRLIMLNVLPEPKEYFCEWPDLEAQTAFEKAEVAVKRMEAMSKYVSGGVESLMTELDFLTRELHYSKDEAEEILAAKMESIDDEDQPPSPLLGLAGGQEGLLQMYQFYADGVLSEEALRNLIKLFYKTDDETTDGLLENLPEQMEKVDPKEEMRLKAGIGPDGKPIAPPNGKPSNGKPMPGKSPFGGGGLATKTAKTLPKKKAGKPLAAANVFCPTGEGGGIDPSCGGSSSEVPTHADGTWAGDKDDPRAFLSDWTWGGEGGGGGELSPEKIKTVRPNKETIQEFAAYRPTEPITVWRSHKEGAERTGYESWSEHKGQAEFISETSTESRVLLKRTVDPSEILYATSRLPQSYRDFALDGEVVLGNFETGRRMAKLRGEKLKKSKPILESIER